VNFTEQEKYLKRSRLWAAVFAFFTLYISFFFWAALFIVAAIAISLLYTPNYLHLNVNSTKRARWQVKIRWRILVLGLVFGLLFTARSSKGVIIVVAAIAWLAVANYVAKSLVPASYSSMYFWLTDCALLAALFFGAHVALGLLLVFLMVAAHLAIVACEKRVIAWTGVVAISGLLLVLIMDRSEGLEWVTVPVYSILFLIPTLSTAVLVGMAQRQNRKNISAAIDELQDFTGYPSEKIRELWATSNEQLAKNWKDAHLDESDREKMTAWYRENSELYMFAISGYNLEYKRIRDSIKMLRYGRGACLDYGAGNGEIILELARRGHAAIYFDVDGTSMRFARHRAERRKLSVEFFHSKDDLAASAKQRGLDTIFSFDVLEHLPDLPGELKFLSSLLNPDGRMAFDVPAGSTKAHPMHLNHHLEVNAYMKSIGMAEEHGLLQRIPFRKQEKYVFRKPA